MRNHQETQLTTEDLQKELAACERTLVTLGPEESTLIVRITNLKEDRKYHVPDESNWVGGRMSSTSRRAIALIDEQLPPLEKRLAEVQPQVRAAFARASEIREAFNAATRAAVERVMNEALLSAPSHEKLVAERQKLVSLQVKLETAKADLQRATEAVRQAFAASQDHRAGSELDLKAKAVLERGDIPEQGELPASLKTEVRKASDRIEVLNRAIDLQKQALDKISGDLAGELRNALLPAHAMLVKRIATGFAEAAAATMELDLIQHAVVSKTGGRGVRALNFHRVHAIRYGNQHPFFDWLTEMRRAGFEV